MSEASSTSDVAVMLEQKLVRKLSESEEQRTELLRELDTLRAQLRDVTAQRDELREAADDYRALVANAYPVDSFGKRKRALERLTKAIEAAR